MAIIDEVNQKIIFSEEEKMMAWKNAPKLINLDQDKFRLCYLCQLPIDYKLSIEKTNAQNSSLGWIVDLLNAKKMDFSFDNLIVVHQGCLNLRKKLDQRKIFHKINGLLWKYNEED